MILDKVRGELIAAKKKEIFVKFLSAVVILVMFSFFSELLAQEVYRWVDDRGIVHFADSLHSIPEKYRREAEKRIFPPSSEMSTPTPQSGAEPSKESALGQISVPFVRKAGQIVVEGFINQRGPVNFTVDIGAIVTTLPVSIASQLGINLEKAIPFLVDTGGNVTAPVSIASQLAINLEKGLPFSMKGLRDSRSRRLVAIDSLRLGELEVNQLEIAITEADSSRIGLLGADFLGRFRIEMDYGLNQMRLARGEGPHDGYPPEWWQQRFRFYRGLIQSYEGHIKERKDEILRIQTMLQLFEPKAGQWEAALASTYVKEIKVYEGYLRILQEKISDLDLRARRAELPRNFRE
jgi:predicted aspartyl protease